MTQQPGATDRPAGEHTYRQTSDGGTQRGSTMIYEDPGTTTSTRAHTGPDQMALPIGSRIRGGPVWAGFAIGFATWILLELALFAADLGALAASVVPEADNSTWWWSGLAAALAFLLGGLVAGASTSSKSVTDGVLHGITVWSLTVVALIVLSAAGVGIGFGVVGDLLATSPSLAEADSAAVNDAQSAAAGALLALTVTLAAAAIGGAIGAKIWPRDDDMIDLRDRRTVRVR
jgi:hypothetical protein